MGHPPGRAGVERSLRCERSPVASEPGLQPGDSVIDLTLGVLVGHVLERGPPVRRVEPAAQRPQEQHEHRDDPVQAVHAGHGTPAEAGGARWRAGLPGKAGLRVSSHRGRGPSAQQVASDSGTY